MGLVGSEPYRNGLHPAAGPVRFVTGRVGYCPHGTDSSAAERFPERGLSRRHILGPFLVPLRDASDPAGGSYGIRDRRSTRRGDTAVRHSSDEGSMTIRLSSSVGRSDQRDEEVGSIITSMGQPEIVSSPVRPSDDDTKCTSRRFGVDTPFGQNEGRKAVHAGTSSKFH